MKSVREENRGLFDKNKKIPAKKTGAYSIK
jgi:hypothetical protein